jgi:hypothetical protein
MSSSRSAGNEAGPFARLHLVGVRCFADAVVPLHEKVTVILGENGSGKTTVAEAMASLVAGEDEGLAEFPLRHGASAGAGSIALYEAGASEAAAEWRAGGERRRLPERRLVLAYGRYRRVQFPEKKLDFDPLGPGWTEDDLSAGLKANLVQIVTGRRTTTLSEPDSHLLRNLGRYIVDVHRGRGEARMDQAWALLDQSVALLGEGLLGLTVGTEGGRAVAMVRGKDGDVALRELSDGYQAMLVIILDLVLRFTFMEPALAEPRERAATVLIDEVDLHLHPRWQRRVVRQLTRLFPKVQWVLTTHSPAVVQGAIDDGYSVLRMVKDGGRTGVDALSEEERKTLDGAQLGSVLVEEHLFGTNSRFSRKYEAMELRTRNLRRRLAKGTATEEERAELLAKLDRLEVLAAHEEKRWAGAAVFKEITKVQLASLKELARLSKEMRDGKTPEGWGS